MTKPTLNKEEEIAATGALDAEDAIVAKAKGKVPFAPVAETIPQGEQITILFPSGIPGALPPRSYAVYSQAKHGIDFRAKAEEMRLRFQGVRVFEISPIDK
jgi:NADP-dependent 3-hydroxy acid dehydrogenase YdfG